MNEHSRGQADDEALSGILARAESLRRGELWTTALVHAVSLLVAFAAVVVLFELAATMWPELRTLNDSRWVEFSSLALLAMAAWVFISAARRSSATRHIEYELLKAEIREIQQRMAHR